MGKHDGYASSTQDHVMTPKDKTRRAGGPGKIDPSGANVSRGPKPSAGKAGIAPAAGPKSGKSMKKGY
jgi:hypothetical protein